MKKTITTLLLLIALLPLTLRGEEVTVYDGTETNEYVPIYGYWADAYQRCQFIIPSTELTALSGSIINTMIFYSSSANVSWTGVFNVYLKEVDYTEINYFVETGTATNVYTGTVNIEDHEMIIGFQSFYTYNGGNLLIGFDEITKGNYANASFYGESVSGACVQGYSSSSLSTVTPTQRNFIPKTTFVLGTPGQYDGRIYVTPIGSGNQNGDSWANATNDINQAIIISRRNGKLPIWVAGGTYYGDGIAEHDAFTMADGVNVYGGFAGNEPADYDLAQRDFEANETILDGQNVQRVLYQSSNFTNNTIWDGLTFRNGYLNNDNANYYGAGVYLRENAIINNSVILNNSTTKFGGGLCAANATVSNCIITNNNAGIQGGGIYSQNSTFINCDIVNNTASYGGGILNISGSCYKNCIIWGNTNGTDPDNIKNTADESPFSYCAIETGFNGEGNVCLSSNNMGSVFSPRFVNPSPIAGIIDDYSEYSWELQIGSICINRGDVAGIIVPEYDIAGNPRIQQGIIDMGCYESPYQAIELPTHGDGIVYVKPNGSGTKQGTSWDNACDNIQDAMAYAFINNCDVWVAAGTYYGNDVAEHNAFKMVADVNIYGGFAGNEPANYDVNLRDFDTNTTILDGQQVKRVVFVSIETGALDGFTIVNGYNIIGGGYGGGIYIQTPKNFDVKNCNILNCIATRGGGIFSANNIYLCNLTVNSTIINCNIKNCTANTYGGGVDASTSIIRDCMIENCYAENYGGGMCVTGNGDTNTDVSVITNCVVRNCNAGSLGGGLYIMRAVIDNCNIYSNSADNGGGIYASHYSSIDTIKNCIVNNNTAAVTGGGIYLYNGHVYNSLIVNNHSNSTGGVYMQGYSSVNNCDIVNNTSVNGIGGLNNYNGYARNTIIWGNKKVQTPSNASTTYGCYYCAIEGMSSDGVIELASSNDGSGNLNYVRFTNPAANDFTLCSNSACVDAGNPNYIPLYPNDLAGNQRIFNNRIDIGCYEYGSHPIIYTEISDEICFGEDYNLNGFNFVNPEVGVHIQTLNLQSMYQCDSIVTLTLTVNPVYNIQLTDEICYGEDYEEYGFQLLSPSVGVYYDTLYLTSEFGCDSIVSLTLTVHDNPVITIFGETQIQIGQSVTLTASGASTYIWSTGETTESIVVTPVETTTYSVVGTDSYGCIGDAEITVTIITGIGEENLNASIKIYPNPTQNNVIVESDNIQSIAIVNSLGAVMHRITEVNNEKCPVNLNDYPNGIYYLKITTNDGESIKTIVKY